MDNAVVADVFGTLGAVFWSIQLLPQIWLNYRRHNAIGLQPSMMMLWAWAGVPLGVYNVARDLSIPLQIQPQILSLLSLLTWIQCYYYEHKWSLWKAAGVVVPVAALMGGIEVGLVFAMRHAERRGMEWPLTLMAVLAALLLALGVLRHYWDIYVHRTVRGISFLFVGLDAAGDLVSIISVAFERHLDILGLVIYGVELALWVGIFAAGGYYNLLPCLKQRWMRPAISTSSMPDNNISPARAPSTAIALHDLPSSTSVFRTPSSDIQHRVSHPAMVEA
ncbi:putative membrane protein [Cercospora beticola]|uniref:Putative membrane protein n=1 Tax=Cercospora beticola TaxID=122368 RepID=A0A2G5HT42_CERBT|nr:putative membrane protein [Cercospora beticola]PIA95707.1 putative membrane protein [Cercospora beticola]WPB07426.1 hypothetical protein RHO25_012087 [Cercospora beticola]